MQKITFTNSIGQSIELTNRAPFLLSKVEGLGDVDASIQLQKAPFQDGSTFTDSILNERLLTFEVAIVAENNIDVQQKRTFLASVFNPKLGEGKLIYENDVGIKEIKAVAENVPAFPSGTDNKGTTYQRSLVNLICPSPFWLDESIESEEMADFIGGLEFDLEIIEEGVELERNGNNRAIINNDGHVSTPIKAFFYGPADNPRITNESTGEFIQVNRTLADGEILYIDTSFGNKRVEIDGANAFNWIDLNSTFFQLQIGENHVSYFATTGVHTARVLLQYRKRYVGV